MCQHKFLLRTLVGIELRKYRAHSGDTQETMSEKLHITPRSYHDLEHGKYGVSSVTLLLFLSLLSDEAITELVRKFAQEVREEEEHVRIA